MRDNLRGVGPKNRHQFDGIGLISREDFVVERKAQLHLKRLIG